ncbi:LysR family transcriptional regulator [Rhodopseudomonas sp. RCAM05734]|uniref:LysR family transcriptional regulator n=1 Tax=Rhodopseudomonas sp. RCAM05734 TaxID=3457549 RepID=UPI00404452F6
MRIHSAAIHYFEAVRRAGSIREAARRLNVASSAVNRQILKLEKEVGAALFDRTVTGLKLTASGEAMARHVIAVLQDLERVRTDIGALKGGHAGQIRIAAVEGVCGEILPDAIQRMRARAPRVTVTVETMGSFAIPSVIAEGLCDIGLAFALPRNGDLHQVALNRFRLGAVVPPDHPIAAKSTTSLAACLNSPIILATPDLSINRLLAPEISRISRALEPAVMSGSVELMRELALRGVGVAFQTRIGLTSAMASGRLVHVPLEANGPIWSDLGVYVRAGRALPTAVDRFVQILADELNRREAEENAALGPG